MPENFFDIQAAYINAKANPDEPMKDSDYVDMMHAMYIPYTDLWRGDKAFSHLLISQNLPLKERIVPRLTELPNRIEEKLRAHKVLQKK